MTDKETKIKNETAKLIELYKQKQQVNEDELLNRLEKLDLDPADIENIYKTLEENGIKLVEQSSAKNDQLLQKIMNEVNIDDSVKMYLKDIGRVPLLTANQADQRQSSSGRQHCQALCRSRNAVSRSDSGRQSRSDEGGRQIRLYQGI